VRKQQVRVTGLYDWVVRHPKHFKIHSSGNSDQSNLLRCHSNGWCFQNDKLTLMANDVVAKGYAGFFYWSNVDQAASVAAYSLTYPIIRGTNPSSVWKWIFKWLGAA
jgi:hypothetical protein